MTVVVGVDGAGRTHRLATITAAAQQSVVQLTPADADPLEALATRLETARADGSTVIVDDAHRLSVDALRLLTAAVRDGVPVAISRRPTIDRPELAELDEAVSAAGGVEFLAPLTAVDVALLVQSITGSTPSHDRAQAILVESAGMPAVAAALASAPPGVVPPALIARVQRRLAMLDSGAFRLARVLAVRLDLTDATLSAAADVPATKLADIMRLLRDGGMLAAGSDRMIPAVAAAVLADLSPAERRRLHNDIANALLATGADPLVTATQLRAARIITPAAADVYRMAAERLRFKDPEAALQWFEDASEAGTEPGLLAAGRAEAAALLGQVVDLTQPTRGGEDVRLTLVTGAVAAHSGRAGRAVEVLLGAGSLGRVLAVPALVAIGRVSEADGIIATSEAPVALRRIAEAAVAVPDPATALPLFIEAAEAVEHAAPTVVLPDTPHALGALVAVTAGDAGTAERLLTAALAAGVGGPVAEDRHRLLLAWVRMRAGRYDTALEELRRFGSRQLSGRERVLLASLAAGIARRSGDIAQLRAAWAQVEHMLARRAVDLFQLEIVEELASAAARLGQLRRATPIVDVLHSIVGRLPAAASWSASLGWLDIQTAIASDDPDSARRVAARMAALEDLSERGDAQCAAARCWADVLAGVVELDVVLVAADALSRAELPWEASRLAGQAAIRTADPATARRLLERAREAYGDRHAATGQPSELLSDRETEVARLVLAGRTHREIGAQLYVSPKTVEHHVARIRTKLGVNTRAEFVAALQKVLDTNTVSDSGFQSPNALS